MPSTTPVTTGSNTTTVITYTHFVNQRHLFAGPEIIILVLGILFTIGLIITMVGLLINWNDDGTPWDRRRKHRLEVMKLQVSEREQSRQHEAKLSMLAAQELKLSIDKLLLEKEMAKSMPKKSLTA
jgi:hypothetical protein